AFGILMAIFAAGAFALGIIGMENGPPLQTMHGIVGLAMASTAILQACLGFLIRSRIARPIHRVVGYVIFLLLIIQAGLGIGMDE
ncbi:MAG: hypothetical protein PHH26_05680, partial [Candidatus Thermoplasmatota archaeon]|nr:hypothetical protein [Candidatus Thermoplasmatota archaeon]